MADKPAVDYVDSWMLAPEQLASLYDDVLNPSFPVDELMPRDGLLRRLARQDSGVCCRAAVDAAGRVLAAIVADTYSRVLLLSYLAVLPEFRDRGVGSGLARDAVPRWIARYRPALVVAEVEDPRGPADSDVGHGDAAARMRLYEGLGGLILPVPYVQPALSERAERVRNLLLMVFYASTERIGADLLVGFLTDYFTVCEGSTPVDAEFTGLIAACRRTDGVPLLKPSEYLSA
ncbi:MAG TPA: GNAT family N-acetyltransferase [Kribbella sp.]|nr:GNAT family N-acetyltransferase [Kribbella sp.]